MAINHRAGSCIVVAAVLLLSASAYAATPTQKCQEQKLKAQGKLELCLKKNSAKVIGGKPDASAACQAKFSAALTKAGTACRYIDNGDGTVSDLNTGLQWEKKDNPDSVSNHADPHDADNTYSWSASGTAADGTAYTDFLAKLNNGASTDGSSITGCFADHCDWRLPTIAELQTILPTPCVTSPCIDPAFGATQPFNYESATTVSSSPGNAWGVLFAPPELHGFSSNLSEDFKSEGNLLVRAVCGGF